VGPLLETQFVEDLVRLLGVERRVQLARAGSSAVWRVLGGSWTTRLPLSGPEHFIQLGAGCNERKRAAEVLVTEPPGNLWIGIVVLIHEEASVCTVQPLPEANRIAALLFVLLERRQLGDIHMADLKVVLARDRAQVCNLQVLR